MLQQQAPLMEHDFGLEYTTNVRKRNTEISMTAEMASEGLRRLVYEVVHCMRPCLNNGIVLLPRNAVDVCRCICPPSHFGLACEYEVSDEIMSRRQSY